MQSFQFTALRSDGSYEPIPTDALNQRRSIEVFVMKHLSQTKRAVYMREWRKKHPLTDEQKRRDNCRSYAGVYLRRRALTREPCFVCDGADVEMHHPDYAEPLNVVWLCRKHHLWLHATELAA